MSHAARVLDSRTSPRFEAIRKVRHQMAGAVKVNTGELVDISHGGLFMWADQAVDLGTRLKVIVGSEGQGANPVYLDARVVRTERDRQTGRVGLGCQCTRMAPESILSALSARNDAQFSESGNTHQSALWLWTLLMASGAIMVYSMSLLM